MSKKHKPGQKITKRSLKVIAAAKCDIRERLRADYEASDPDTPKRLHIFRALHTHEKKHGCGPKFVGGSNL